MFTANKIKMAYRMACKKNDAFNLCVFKLRKLSSNYPHPPKLNFECPHHWHAHDQEKTSWLSFWARDSSLECLINKLPKDHATEGARDEANCEGGIRQKNRNIWVMAGEIDMAEYNPATTHTERSRNIRLLCQLRRSSQPSLTLY